MRIVSVFVCQAFIFENKRSLLCHIQAEEVWKLKLHFAMNMTFKATDPDGPNGDQFVSAPSPDWPEARVEWKLKQWHPSAPCIHNSVHIRTRKRPAISLDNMGKWHRVQGLADGLCSELDTSRIGNTRLRERIRNYQWLTKCIASLTRISHRSCGTGIASLYGTASIPSIYLYVFFQNCAWYSVQKAAPALLFGFDFQF